MQVNKYNISKPTKYTDKNNQEKTRWNQVGTMTEFLKDDGSISRIMDIPAIGLEANIFPWEDRGSGNGGGNGGGNRQNNTPPRDQGNAPPGYNPDEEITVDQIPF
ncbi:MAG TPA: hypothetical protein ENI08_02180 [Candidatus Dependentiae bacterium]|nr:hypothetical protein [Candidatus Dependentiae bacterium]